MAKVNKSVKTNTVAKNTGKGGKGKTADKGKPKGGKKGKPKSLAVAAAPLKLTRKALADNASVRTDSRGVVRKRAKIFGFSVSSVWRWCGFNGWTLDQTRQLRDAVGLAGVITDANVACQHGDGNRFREGGTLHYSTPESCVPDLPPAVVKQLNKLVD